MAAIVAKETRTCGKVVGNRTSVNYPESHIWLKVTNPSKTYVDEYLVIIDTIRKDWFGNVISFETDNYRYEVK